MMKKKTQIRKMKSKPLFRTALFDREHIDADARTVELAFSSEEPVERWFGQEILDHTPSAVRLGRLQNSGPILVDHDHRDHVGVIESVSIDKDRRGRATVRFGKSARAMEIFQDVVDGIRTSVSVGYRIHKAVLEETGDDSADIYRVTDWEPFEVSLVSVPADDSVGLGRGADDEENEIIIESINHKERTMDPKENTPAVEMPDVKAIASEARTAELERIRTITSIGEKHDTAELARTFVDNGKSVDDFRAAVLERREDVTPVGTEVPEIGLSDKEVRKFSFVRAINALANPTDRRAQEAAAFEIDASRAAADKTRQTPQGILVPADVIKRDLSAGTTTAGGHTVATDLLAQSFIEMLRNRMVVEQLGSTTLTDLVGDVAIPSQTGGATGYWISSEGGSPTESQQVFGQVTFTPKTVGAYTDYTRQLLMQSSIDIESFVRADLSRVLGLAIDLAAFYGSGSSGQPTGIANTTGINTTTFGAADPTYVEVVAMESAVATDNADVGTLGYAMDAAMRGALKTTVKDSGSGQFVWEPGNTVNGYQTGVSNQMTDGDIIYGNFADLIIAMWGGLDLTVDPYTNSTSGTVRIVALQSMDIGVRHAVSFCKSNDGA